MAESVFEKPLNMPYTEPAPPTDFGEFKKVVESRRSVRVYDGAPVPEDVMRECLRLALLAPNSSNLQPWEFVWVRSPEKKAALARACFSQPAARTASELVVCVARLKSWKRHRLQMLAHFRARGDAPRAVLDYYDKLVPIVYGQGPLSLFGACKRTLLFMAGFFRAVPREPVSRADMRVWAVKSTALACENLMLALRAAGFDSCPIEGYDSRRLRRLLALPQDAEVVMVVSAGQRAANGVYGERVRFPDSQFLHEI